MRGFNPNDIEIDFVDSTEKAFECLRWMSDVQTEIMAVDVETDGLDWFDGKLRLVQFGTLTQGWAIPYEQFRHLVDELLQILKRRRLPLVGHNFKFDLHWLDKHTNWTPDRWADYHDTLLLASVIDSSGAKGLKELSQRLVSPIAKSGQVELARAMKENRWSWGTVPVNFPAYWVYGVLDTILTANLFYVLQPKARSLGVLDAYEVERGCVPALYAMENHGMLVDSDHCHTQLQVLHGRMSEIEAEVEQYGISNIGSGDQLIRAFLDSGVILTKRTESGRKYSMSKDTLNELAAQTDHPLVQLVHAHRQAGKYSSSYYDNFLRYQRSDGRVHPMYNQSQARTGRMSANFPAIQTIPRPDSDINVRNSFVADEGCSLISTDFGNMEAKIFAHFAQEHGMLDAFRSGTDLHGYTAHQMYGEWPETGVAPKDHPKRQISKSVLFAKLFGAGYEQMAATAGVPLEQAIEADTRLVAAFPGIRRFQKEVERTARDNMEDTGRAWIRGFDGRILAMRENDDRYYAFTNWLIQGTATVVLKQRLRVIHAMGLAQYCVAAIHDEIVAEVPDEMAEDFAHEIADAMLDEVQFSVPITAEPGKPAKRLGDAK